MYIYTPTITPLVAKLKASSYFFKDTQAVADLRNAFTFLGLMSIAILQSLIASLKFLKFMCTAALLECSTLYIYIYIYVYAN